MISTWSTAATTMTNRARHQHLGGQAGVGRFPSAALTILIFFVFASSTANACPFYQLTAPRTNYTTIGAALTEAFSNGLPVRVCDVAKIKVNETIPVISQSVSVIGDVGTSRAYLTVEDLSLSPVFVITADSVTFQDLNIINQNTLFSVQGTGFLLLQHVRVWFGKLGVSVNVASTISHTTGVEADHTMFISSGVGILQVAGDVLCRDCDVVDARDAAFITRTSNFNTFLTEDCVFVNVLIPYASQTMVDGPLIRVDVSEKFVDEASIINCKTYPEECPSAEFGAGGGGGGGGGSSQSDLSIILWGTLIAVCVLTVIVMLIVTLSREDNFMTNFIVNPVRYERIP
jgi:hypothetical protein